MKKSALLLATILLAGIGSAHAIEPLLLEPLQTVLASSPSTYGASTTVAPYKTPIGGGVYEATYTPAAYPENMVPQNAAAKGEPIPVREEPRVRIQTKQRSQGNAYWNPGGKGTKSYF